MKIEAPLALHTGSVLSEWIDYNGHMNLAFYMLAFDHATDAFFDYLELDEEYRASNHATTYSLEAHITYQRELKEGDPIRVTTQLLDHDEKRMHYFHKMYHAEEGYLAATNELMSMHMDTETVRGAAMPAEVVERIEAVMEVHRSLPRPPEMGSVIGIRRN